MRAMNLTGKLFLSEKVITAVILLNSVTLFCMGFSAPGVVWHRVCFAIDYACLVFFLLEAMWKIRTFSLSTYWASRWNRFDLTIVILSLPALLTPFVDLHSFAAILIIRLGRLFRLFRLLRFIPNIDHLILGLSRALKASVGIFLALLIVNLIFALGATFLFQELAPEYFGNPLQSLYSIFKVFTVEGWYEIPDLIAERSSFFWAFFARLYFVATVLVGGILGLSLANAVFIDEMTIDNNRLLEDKIDLLTSEITQLKEMLKQTAIKNIS